MKAKEDIINKIIKDNDYHAYLEIGYGNGYNFNRIKCDIKNACDPNKNPYFIGDSDAFFDAHKDNVFDIVFIDGLHHAEQVRKDIINSIKQLTENGAIVLHDSIPPSKSHQVVPRKQTSWTGDVWKAVVGFKQSYPSVEVYTYRSDYGITVIKPNGKKVKKHFEKIEMTYEEFKSNEVELLNIID